MKFCVSVLKLKNKENYFMCVAVVIVFGVVLCDFCTIKVKQ